jgi:hypothetical protein
MKRRTKVLQDTALAEQFRSAQSLAWAVPSVWMSGMISYFLMVGVDGYSFLEH